MTKNATSPVSVPTFDAVPYATMALDNADNWALVSPLLSDDQKTAVVAAAESIMAERAAAKRAEAVAKFSTQFVDGTDDETIAALLDAMIVLENNLPRVVALKDNGGSWRGYVVRLGDMKRGLKVTLSL